MDPRAPVIVGAGQATQRPDDLTQAREPIDLLADAARAADTDAGAPVQCLRRSTRSRSSRSVSWKYPTRAPSSAVASASSHARR